MRTRLLYILVTLILLGGTGCMSNSEGNTIHSNEAQTEVIKQLKKTYDEEFRIVEVEEGGVTVAGRAIPNQYLVESVENGTKFRYVIQNDGEIDDYYLPMKYGNKLYDDILSNKIKEIYGDREVKCQLLFYTNDNEDAFAPNDIEGKPLKIYLALEASHLDKDMESKLATELYNSILGSSNKILEIAFFRSFPSDINNFLDFEITGVNNSFSSLYEDQMSGRLLLFSNTDGDTVELNSVLKRIKSLPQED